MSAPILTAAELARKREWVASLHGHEREDSMPPSVAEDHPVRFSCVTLG